MTVKRRRAKKTILIVGEGFTDKAFLQHIKELFVTRNSNIAVKIEHGNGGSPVNIVEKALKLRSAASYDNCFVLFDADIVFVPTTTLKQKMKKKPEIQVLNATPCIEGLFLAILNHSNFSQNTATTRHCKHAFDNYIPNNKKTDNYSYRSLFTIEMIKDRRNYVPELDAILNAMNVTP